MAASVLIACKIECVPFVCADLCSLFHPPADPAVTARLVTKASKKLGLPLRNFAPAPPKRSVFTSKVRKCLLRLSVANTEIQEECEQVALTMMHSQPSRKLSTVVGASLFLVLHKACYASILDSRPSLHTVSRACGDCPNAIFNALAIQTSPC
eukprot:c17457_g1_i3.p1 GENE.c17457_g1_i3~~c17457_g1_i3.p1  ORF type:complete len:153 (+),score=22.67 c17457_g1_i3:501-959(+)